MLINDVQYEKRERLFYFRPDSLSLEYFENCDYPRSYSVPSGYNLSMIVELNEPLKVIDKNGKEVRVFDKLRLRISESKTIELPLFLDESDGHIRYSSDSLNVPDIFPSLEVFAPSETLNIIAQSFNSYASTLIGIRADMYFDSKELDTYDRFLSQPTLLIDEKCKAVLDSIGINKEISNTEKDVALLKQLSDDINKQSKLLEKVSNDLEIIKNETNDLQHSQRRVKGISNDLGWTLFILILVGLYFIFR